MLRVALSRRWWGWHALLIAGLAVLIFLGHWQWSRARSESGTLQNLGYAFEWWLFAVLAVYGWWREIRADARAARAAGAGVETAPSDPATHGLRREPAQREVAVEEADPELAAYNTYLAQLNARYERSRSPR